MLISLLAAGCGPGSAGQNGAGDLQEELTIFHAGSLTVPVHHLTEAFQEKHPGVRFRTEAAGSRTTARKISELERQADVVMSADYEVIDTLLVPDFASWNILFARNTMVIAYTDRSRYARDINGQNWHRILLREDVRFGHSDPDADPNGYRTLMVWRLAETHYREPGLYQQLDAASPQAYVRPKSTDLIALLQTGDLDYAFSYRSVALQHALQAVTLPDDINLGRLDYADTYDQVKVTLNGREPGDSLSRQGQPILYGLTIPDNAPNPELAVEFLTFLFSAEGRSIMKEHHQLPLHPPTSPDVNRLPLPLQSLVKRMEDR